MLTEVPVAYSLEAKNVPRYRVVVAQSVVEVLTPSSSVQSNGAAIATSSARQPDEDVFGQGTMPLSLDQKVGATSASLLHDGSIVMTSGKEDNQWGVLLVTLMKADQRVAVEIDVNADSVAKVQCVDDETHGRIALLCADAKGLIRRIFLDRHTLEPDSKCSIVSLPNLLDEIDARYSGAMLLPTMVEFISSTVAIVALSPYVITADLGSIGENSDDAGVFIWSVAEAKQKMTGGVVGMLSMAGDMLVGRAVADRTDLPAVSALALADKTHVVSLHTDGTLRLWTIDANHRPEALYDLGASDIPDPTMWVANTTNSIAVTTKLFRKRLYTAVGIETQHGFSLVVIHCTTTGGSQSSIRLVLPNTVVAVRTMTFSTAPSAVRSECVLTVGTETEDGGHRIIRYGPNRLAVIATTPRTVAGSGFLDDTAAQELARASRVAPSLSCDGQDMNSIDSSFLKLLFRPIYPRGNGTVLPPSDGAVSNAIRKCVPGFLVEPGRRIEAETVRAIHEWRNAAHSGSPPTWDMAHEQNRVAFSGASAQEPMDVSNQAGNANESDTGDTTAKHIEKWKALLQTVLEEEAAALQPLRLQTLEDETLVLMRAGVASVVWEEDSHIILSKAQSTVIAELDKIVDTVMTVAEAEGHQLIDRIETVAFESMQSLTDISGLETMEVSMQANLQELVSHSVTLQSENSLSEVFSTLTEKDIIDWVSTTPRNAGAVVAALAAHGTTATPDSSGSGRSDNIAGLQARHGACSLVVRALDQIRRRYLGKCLVLAGYGVKVYAHAMRRYLHSLTMLWVCGQRVKTNIALTTDHQPLSMVAPSPAKRLVATKNVDQRTGFFVARDGTTTTTALDAHIVDISCRHDYGESRASSADECVVTLAARLMGSVLSGTSEQAVLPELSLLPYSSGGDAVSSYPRLALRLMLPFSNASFDGIGVDDSTWAVRNEALVECLLMEADKAPKLVPVLWKKALTLLARPTTSTDSYQQDHLASAYDWFAAFGAGTALEVRLSETAATAAMTAELKSLLSGDDNTAVATPDDISMLCSRETTRTLFLPFFLAGRTGLRRDLGRTEADAVVQLVRALLDVSKILRKVELIQKHKDRAGSQNGLAFIGSSIALVEKILPSSMYLKMPEYSAMWSTKFRVAEASQEWNVAHDTCKQHPKMEHRSTLSRGLIASMIEAGALGDLIELRNGLVMSPADICDLDEILADVLTSGTFGNVFASPGVPDTFGALFALEINRRRWKGAAEALWLRYDDAVSAFAGAVDQRTMNVAVRGLSSSVSGSGAALALVSNPNERFLIGGEVGTYPCLPAVNEADLEPKSILKRGRDEDANLAMDGDTTTTSHSSAVPGTAATSIGSSDRLSRFFTIPDIQSRAVYCLGLVTLVEDVNASSLPPIDLTGKVSGSACREMVHALADSGYMDTALLVCQMPFLKSNGIRATYHNMSYLACDYLVPLSCQPYKRPGLGNSRRRRPTLGQAMDFAGQQASLVGNGAIIPSWTRHWKADLQESCAVGSCSMYALSCVSRRSSTSASPIAVDAANAFLQHQPSSPLPQWLHNQLVGNTAGSGSFATMATTKISRWCDPATLLCIYLNNGFYKEGCDLVTCVLMGKEHEQRMAAPQRLPEKGGMVHVPVDKIDLLWDSVENELQFGTMSNADSTALLAARNQMERAIEFHFEMLQVSRQGAASARAANL